MPATPQQRLYRLRVNLRREQAALERHLRNPSTVNRPQRIAAIERRTNKTMDIEAEIAEITKSLPKGKSHV